MACDKEYLKSISEIKLPYNSDNLAVLDIEKKVNVTGSNLNIIPKELLQNDLYIYEKLDCIYQTIPELEGINSKGLVEHINLFISNLVSIKNTDKALLKLQYDFLLKNDCNLSAIDAFPCDKISKYDIYAEFDNTHLQYIDRSNANCVNELNDEINCK